MGFANQLQEIIRRLPDARQTLLFSATLPKLLVEFARAGNFSPVSHLMTSYHWCFNTRVCVCVFQASQNRFLFVWMWTLN